MTAWWIALAVAALLTAFLLASVTVKVMISDTVRIWVGAFGIRFLILPAKQKKQRKRKQKKKVPSARKKKPAEKSRKKPKEKPHEQSFGETVSFAVDLLRSTVPGAAALLKKIRFVNMRVFVSVGADSADETAIRYGMVCGAVYNTLAAIDSVMTLRVKSVDVVSDFVTGEMRYDISFLAKLRIGSILKAAIGILISIVRMMFRRNAQQEEALQAMQKQKGLKQYERTSDQRHDGHNNGKNPQNGGCKHNHR
ncbi:hypothetical protein H6A12_00085 [Phocea massiliensis]|uniref:DUF2953 domain-containing protein n=1 Tax=Merdimmobilis hominis TaxID=2897707 RepID=A0A939BD36_9FIRM|nr:hypothetical protein [Merdimmobilis hominis]MBM6919572.1 hypothetical protein [Merdimmobilis hominis]